MMPVARLPFALFTFALLPVACLSTEGCSSSQPRILSTHAVAHRRLSNDVADVSVGIQAEGASMADVTGKLSTRSQTLLAYLKQQGADRVSTGQVSLEPKIYDPERGADRIVGYSASMTVTFRAAADKVSDLMAGALEQGGNTLGAVVFTTREEETAKAREELSAEATKDALAQADSVARAAGTHVVGVQQIVVDPENATLYNPRELPGADDRPVPFMAAMKRQEPIATAAGDQDLSIEVAVQVEVAK